MLTPAGHFEDPSVLPSKVNTKTDEPTRGRTSKPGTATNSDIHINPASASSVFIYSRANFARPPIAQLPGHKKASIAVRFSPVLYELRDAEGASIADTKVGTLHKEMEGKLALDIKPALPPSILTPAHSMSSDSSGSQPGLSPLIMAPAPRRPPSSGDINIPMQSPTQSPIDRRVPMTPLSQPPTPAPAAPPTTGSVFALPYRMMFSVVTMDTVAIYDTQQAGPIALLTKLHYDEFTDMTWYVQT